MILLREEWWEIDIVGNASFILYYGKKFGDEDRGWDVVVAGDINISRSHIDSFPQLRMGKEHV